jgi:hypothetical protein
MNQVSKNTILVSLYLSMNIEFHAWTSGFSLQERALSREMTALWLSRRVSFRLKQRTGQITRSYEQPFSLLSLLAPMAFRRVEDFEIL